MKSIRKTRETIMNHLKHEIVTNKPVIDAIKTLSPAMVKRTDLWNRVYSEIAGIKADGAWKVRGDLWLIENDFTLMLFMGDVHLAVGRHQVLKTLVDYVF
jgi:hypothetical protein